MASLPSARRLALLLLTPLLTVLVAGSAQGAMSVSPGGTGISVGPTASGPDGLSIDTDGAGHYLFFGTGIASAGLPCTDLVNNSSNTKTTCPADGIRTLFVGFADTADTLATPAINNVTASMIVFGHGGADNLKSGDGTDSLSGGTGNDTLDGGANDDLVTDDNNFQTGNGGGNDDLKGGAGADTVDAGVLGAGVNGATSGGGHDLLDGGTEIDTADYSKRTAAVTVTVDSPGNVTNSGDDGEAGEADNVIHIERILGGTAGDFLTGSGVPTTLEGHSGNDTLVGLTAADTLVGGLGIDALSGGGGGDTLDGGFGSDSYDGGAGDDTIAAQDGEVDTIICGTGNDTVQADGFDNIAADCETVTRTAAVTPPGQTLTQTVTVEVPTVTPPQAGPLLTLPKALKADSKGRVKVTVGCPKATKAGCLFGALTLSTAPKTGKGKKIAVGTFSLKPGKVTRVTLTLNAAARKSLKKSRKLAVTLTATAINGDVQGRTTTAKLTVKR